MGIPIHLSSRIQITKINIQATYAHPGSHQHPAACKEEADSAGTPALTMGQRQEQEARYITANASAVQGGTTEAFL